MRPADQTTVLVTGATDGLGRAVAERIAGAGATVLLHGRDPERLEATREEIAAATGSDRLRTLLADLSSLADVRRLAEEVARTTPELHVLVSNAGIGPGEPDDTVREESADGHELRFAVNYLAGVELTLRLLPLLRRSAPARVVLVASAGQERIDFDDVMLERAYDGWRAYRQSKLAQVMFGFELAERVAADGITVTSLHPATFMPTKMVTAGGYQPIDELETGVAATVRLALGDDVEGVTGRYYNRQAEARADAQAYDPEARRRLWELSLRLTGAPPPA
jgi:NAD(P)-dependent dehydrogenase (short-subunit alcohol dehydrogenase family)